MSFQVAQIDAFTELPFAGNPAAVCLLDSPRDEQWMQSVAGEMNLSETAFLMPRGGVYGIRWFTPTTEVDLCGHATLAAAHFLWTEANVPRETPLQFDSPSGPLSAKNKDGRIWLDLPATPTQATSPPPALADTLGALPLETEVSPFDLLVLLSSEEEVRCLKPALNALALLPYRGCIVTATSDMSGVDFVSRFFAPAAGIDEDPVCGSAHCALGPYWQRKLRKSEFEARQLSPRGGAVRVIVERERVSLGGHAITVLRGTIL